MTSLNPDQRSVSGAFDIIGDIHGCHDELKELLKKLGYRIENGNGRRGGIKVTPPPGRRAIFVGDFVDRGPKSMPVLRLVMAMVDAGQALAVIGNHDDKFWRWLLGRRVTVSHGLATTIAEFSLEPEAFKATLLRFFETLPAHLWLDEGRLAVAHAGIKKHMLGKTTKDVRRFCLYGDTAGKKDPDGLPIRYHWAARHDGETTIVYGHTPVEDAGWVNNTLCIDTGCCFGGKLSCLRWPEREIVTVNAAATYTPLLRPFGHPPLRSEPPPA